MKNIRIFTVCVLTVTCLLSVSCGKLPEIEFAQAGIDLSRDFETLTNSISTEDMEIFGKSYPVYKIKKEKLNQRRVKDICQIFEMSESKIKSFELYSGYTENDKSLQFNSNTFFKYSFTPRGYENIPIVVDDDTLINKATEFLKEHDLLPEDFSYSSMGQGTKRLGDEEPVVYEKIVGFKRTIDGHPVIGNSHIHVGYYQDAISYLSVAYNEYKSWKSMQTVSYEDAIEQFRRNDIIIEYDAEVVSAKLKEIELTSAEVVYVEHAYDEQAKYIQPAFRFRGVVSDAEGHSSDWAAIVRAIRN